MNYAVKMLRKDGVATYVQEWKRLSLGLNMKTSTLVKDAKPFWLKEAQDTAEALGKWGISTSIVELPHNLNL